MDGARERSRSWGAGCGKLLLLAGASAIAHPALAQQGTSDASTSVAEVVVTATKRGNESLQKVPIAITALSQATLQAKGAEDFIDFARSVPSLSFVDSGPGQKTYIIRGVNSTGTGVATVGQYIDDILITGDLRQPDLRLYDVQRVEVLRDPRELCMVLVRCQAPSAPSPTRRTSTATASTSWTGPPAPRMGAPTTRAPRR